MIKSFLILTILSISLFCSQQIVLVVADDFNKSRASLELIEDNKLIYSTTVNLGTNGLGWGIGEDLLTTKTDEPLKYEGDKKAPAGVFKLTDIFGYDFGENYKLPYLHASEELICVDDSNSSFYNQIIQKNGNEKSFEFMKRQDKQYKYGVVVKHNSKAKYKRGSCIFLHIQRDINASTAGCTSMSEADMKRVINWLDKEKNPLLIQIPRSSSKEILSIYTQLQTSKILKD